MLILTTTKRWDNEYIMEKNQEQLNIFCQILMVVAFLEFIGGIYALFVLWETSHYTALVWLAAGIGSALFIYAIIQIIVLLENIKRNTRKTQENLELMLKSLSK